VHRSVACIARRGRTSAGAFDDIEEDREELEDRVETSETIESGEDAEDVERARDDRRTGVG
jgi:hypothetical protein